MSAENALGSKSWFYSRFQGLTEKSATFADGPQPIQSEVTLPPKAHTKLWSSLAFALARATRWSLFAVAGNIVWQLASMVVTGKWPPRSSTENTMRGVDFYPWKDFISALIRGAYMFRIKNGYVPHLASPTSFNEHIFVRKFFAPLPMPSLADKLAAKEHVKRCLGEEFLPTVVWVGDDVDGLVAAKPPAGHYVLKPNHSSDSNLFLNLPDDLTAKRHEIEQRARVGSLPGSGTIGASGNILPSSRSCFWRNSSILTASRCRMTTSSTVFTARLVSSRSTSTASRN